MRARVVAVSVISIISSPTSRCAERRRQTAEAFDLPKGEDSFSFLFFIIRPLIDERSINFLRLPCVPRLELNE